MAGFGAFGKMPSAGDFFRLNTPGGFVRVWDAWLQQIMLDGRAAYGAGFDAHYMTAPIWRFTLPAGLAGAGAVMGVMMPSVDRVGRRFPLTLMAAAPGQGAAGPYHFGEAALFERLEDVALDALEDTMTKDRLAATLAEIPAPAAPAAGAEAAAGMTMVLAGAQGAERLTAASDDARLADCSLWTAVLDGVPRTLACSGLPQGAAALGLFDLGATVWAGAGVS
ncbi:type VI secretion system-associated protein TagF (plasmid) [Leisingera aquaemixtae]|uniref:Type VI secretion system-associated protein TagF n=1 Tax=Leisingera aquaemixtae TaxID=1396826 RepID=A0ABY5WQ81_9RHOB|nr:type VI secretion system-associated protein TagF [Leisingera aquaemixtae]UWQ43704.1 type VI secretion system-associated protein TagF [Leisingera aquaemixtae]